jgi:hypothetical protein
VLLLLGVAPPHPTMSLADLLQHGDTCLEITLYAGFSDGRRLHSTCRAANEVGTSWLRFFDGLSIGEAHNEGAYDKHWDVWGPQPFRRPGTVVGRFPRCSAHARHAILHWSFRDWRARGDAFGLLVFPLQQPLYYKKVYDEIILRYLNRHECTMKACGKLVYYEGAAVRGKDRPMDLCHDCSRYLVKRGSVRESSLRRNRSPRTWRNLPE